MSKGKETILLSILIPTLHSRKLYFDRLVTSLLKQAKEGGNTKKIEILSYPDNRKVTTGYKRNKLIEKAKGLFTVFIDDDDDVDANYIELVLKAITENEEIDAIGINGIYSENNSKRMPFETSLKHNWEERNGWYYRTINHISPVRREHALKIKFPDKTMFEDYEWTMDLKNSGLLKKEFVIKKPIYFYNFVLNKNY